MSKSGVGISTGVKGFRISANSRGTFVNMGVGGIHYRKKIAGPYLKGGTSTQPPTSPSGSATNPKNVETAQVIGSVETVSATHLIDQRSEQLIADINETVGAPGSMLILVPIAVASTLLATAAAPIMLWIMALLWIGPLIYAFQVDKRNRTYSLLFELDAAQEAKWNDLSARLSRLSSSSALWRVASVVSTSDWKRHAGATELVDRVRVKLIRKAPKRIATNVAPWCFKLNDQTLYFFPDRLLIQQGDIFGSVEYDELRVSLKFENFVESQSCPSDAQVVGSTWEHPNKDGSADRRFAQNRRVPIVRYAKLIHGSSTGLNIHIQVSSQQAAQSFAEWFMQFDRPHRANPTSARSNTDKETQTQSRPKAASGKKVSSSESARSKQSNVKSTPAGRKSVPACYAVLGLDLHCTKDQASAAYRNLARKYHPDLVAGLDTALREIANERMKEINVAYGEIRSLNQW